MIDRRFVLCECCQSEGRIYRDVRPRWGEPYEDDCGQCPVCCGAGEEEIEVEPVEMDDDR